MVPLFYKEGSTPRKLVKRIKENSFGALVGKFKGVPMFLAVASLYRNLPCIEVNTVPSEANEFTKPHPCTKSGKYQIVILRLIFFR